MNFAVLILERERASRGVKRFNSIDLFARIGNVLQMDGYISYLWRVEIGMQLRGERKGALKVVTNVEIH